MPGNDHYHAMDKEDLKVFDQRIEKVYELLGAQQKFPLTDEEISRKNARRSLVSSKALKKGEVITEKDLTWEAAGCRNFSRGHQFADRQSPFSGYS